MVIRRFVLSACLVCLIGLIGLNLQALLAERFALPARHLLTLENSSEWRERDAIYAKALSSIDSATALQGSNPGYLDIKGRLLIQRCKYWDKLALKDEWKACQKQALSSIQQAVSINARSPHLWTNLLLVKSNLEQFDADFNEALINARLLGPNDFDVNRTVAHIGLLHWLLWQPEQKDLFRSALFTVQAISPQEAKKIAELSGKSALYCFWTRNDPRQFYSCKKKPVRRKASSVSRNVIP